MDFKEKKLTLKYLGCMLFSGRKNIVYFNDILIKFERKLAGRKSKLLSTGGRIILIKHGLQSLPVYMLADIDPPKAILNRIESICANFLWGESEYGLKYH